MEFCIHSPSQPEGKPVILVVPTSLQMGWVESLPYFCAATETARDIATDYIEMPIGSLPTHKFGHHTTGNCEYEKLPTDIERPHPAPRYLTEVYVDDFMSVIIPVPQKQFQHVATAVMTGIHDVFPADNDDGNDPISNKELKKLEGQYSTVKTLLGFDFNGITKTKWLEPVKREKLLTVL